MAQVTQTLKIKTNEAAGKTYQSQVTLLGLTVVGVVVLALLNHFTKGNVLRTDNDAMLRLVEIRDLLGGQSWFDLMQSRMGMPGGFEMHWSRLVDAPISALILAAQAMGFARETAENVALYTWPVLVSAVAMFSALRIAHAIGGLAAMIFTLIIAVPTFQLLSQFPTGQIDHHNVQIALSLTFMAAILGQKPSAVSGAIAGLCLALMVGVGAETQVHVVVGAVIVAMLFLFQQPFQLFAGSFGFAFALSCGVIFFGTLAPVHYWRATCDAFSIAQALPGAIGGLAFGLACTMAGPNSSLSLRMTLLAGTAAVSAMALWPASLGCLGDPLANLDPLVQKFWLVYIEEAKPLEQVWVEGPSAVFAYLAPAFLGVFVAIAFILKGNPQQRLAAIIIGGMVLPSLALVFHQFRASVLGAHLIVPLLGIAAAVVFRWADGPGKTIAHRLVMAVFVLACVGHGWGIAAFGYDAIQDPEKANILSVKNEACDGPELLADLNALPPTTIFAVSNLGSDILLDTNHRVVAGPYHRNVAGIKAVIQAHILSANQTFDIMKSTGSTHYIWCPDAPETDVFVEQGGFAADMKKGEVPNWLLPISKGAKGTYVIYRITG
jgi:hypothetical protein